MTVQDDAREKEVRALFKLGDGDGREGTDAYLVGIASNPIPFELKSTTRSGFSTVRDLGPDHITKWRKNHWLFAVYDEAGAKLQYTLYGPPSRMEAWIKKMEEYVGPDFIIAEVVPEMITMGVVNRIFGTKPLYSFEDARRLQKSQYSQEEYGKRMDKPAGYSPERMLEIVQERCRYLIERGSTLNNPHIPMSYFEGWERITANHANRLRDLVRLELGVKLLM